MNIPENVRLPPFLCICNSLLSVTDSRSVFAADSYNLCGVSGTAVAGSWNRVSCTEPTRSRYVIFQVDFHFPLMTGRKLAKTKTDIDFQQFFYRFLHSPCKMYLQTEKKMLVVKMAVKHRNHGRSFYNNEQIKFAKS